MVIGGQAVLRYGEVRLTKDIDLSLGLGPADAKPPIELLSTLGLRHLVEDSKEFLPTPFKTTKVVLRSILFLVYQTTNSAKALSRDLKPF
jgi:hypothetical protein